MLTRLQVRLIACLAALCGAWWLTAAASAHHSHGNYGDNFIDLQGTVKEVHLLNPHSWVYLDVRGPNGQPQTWALEATNRIGLERVGVTADSLKPGEAIKARCHPLRDGSRGCLLGFVKTKDGTVTDWDGTRLPVPADF
ncbi:MAG: DUF6152 family protein [Vicinamibacterales bacterium]